MKRFIWFIVLTFCGLQSAQAGGFMVGEMATRSSGMGSAFTAVADDASAAWHNPAGVAFTKGGAIMVGGDLILTSNKYISNAATLGPANTANAKDGAFVIPHAYFTYWDEGSKLGAALSINSPFGLETEWPATAAFSSKNTFSRINMVMVNPSIIFQASDRLSFAAGVDYAYLNQVDLNNTGQNLNGNGDGWGGNASIFYKGDGFNFGINYRSKIKVDLKGTARAQGAFAALTGATSSAATTSVTLPDQVNVGVAIMPNDQLTLSFDADWVNWKTYDAINIRYLSALYRAQLTAATGSGQTDLPQNWKATVDLRAGAEWKYLPHLRARFGYVFSPTPINDVDFSPSIPGNDRHIVSIGHGYDVNSDTTIDIGYAYVHVIKRNQTQSTGGTNAVKNGIYKGNAHIIMASLSYRF